MYVCKYVKIHSIHLWLQGALKSANPITNPNPNTAICPKV